jgi:protein-S-isoprenylcysteine O-methyltransferase Ste14
VGEVVEQRPDLVGTIIVGQMLFFGQLAPLGYAAVYFVAVAAFVHLYEEPTLRTRYGEEYEVYRREVPAWLPRWSR